MKLLLKPTDTTAHRRSKHIEPFHHYCTIANMTPRQTIFALLTGASLISAAPALERRQGCINPGTGTGPVRSDWRTTLIGDGDVSQVLREIQATILTLFALQPHQSYKYIQLTDNTDCNGNVGCEIAETEVEGMYTQHSNKKLPLTIIQEEASAGLPGSAAVAGSAAASRSRNTPRPVKWPIVKARPEMSFAYTGAPRTPTTLSLNLISAASHHRYSMTT